MGSVVSSVTSIDFDELLHQTDDAYKLRIANDVVWLPKAVCSNFDEEDGTVDVYENFAIDKGLV